MRPWLRRSLRVGAAAVVGIAVLLIAVWVLGNTDPGRRLIERATARLTGGQVTLVGLGGDFPFDLTLRELRLRDEQGVWLTADNVTLRFSPLRLLGRVIDIDDLRADRLQIERAPVGGKSTGKPTVPHIEVGHFVIGSVELGAALVGERAILTASGALRLRSLDDADGDLVARRRNGEGDYTAHLRFDRARMEASLAVHEPAGGPLENLLSLPGLGALSVSAALTGPRRAEQVAVKVDAGVLHGELEGSIDLEHRAAELRYLVKAAAMAPRADLSWDRVALQGTWHGPLSAPQAGGTMDLAGLRIAGGLRIANLAAKLSADASRLGVHAVVAGLETPGPAPRLLADDPLTVDATWAFGAVSHPLQLTASHRLFSLRARADTAGKPLHATASLTLPDLQPLAALGAVDVRGSATMALDWTHAAGDDLGSLDARAEITGGTAPWLSALGTHAALKVAGGMAGDSIRLQSLRMVTDAMTVTASGTAEHVAQAQTPAESLRDLQLHWQLDIPELKRLFADAAGDLKGSGDISGSPAALAFEADLESQLSVRGSPSGAVRAVVHARDLPKSPTGTLTAHGMLDGAPLDLDAAVERVEARSLRIAVRRADWKSAHIDGDMTTDRQLSDSRGHLHLVMAQLGDFDRLLGTTLAGSLEATLGFLPVKGHTQAHLVADGRGLSLGSIAGDVHLDASGVASSLALQMSGQSPALRGSPARFAAAATLDADSRALRIVTFSADYRDQTLRLLGPAQVSFANGIAVDDVRLGLRNALFDVNGRLAPVLDVRASLTHLDADLVNAFQPGLLAGGTLQGRARLQGTMASPSGRVRLDATGVRFADDAAAGLPAAELHARAELADDTARIEATLSAGAGSQIKASGSAPLNPNGELDLKVGGKLDVGMVNPLLEARGLHAAGLMNVDATVTGSSEAPLVGGGITLTGGSVRDYARGVSLSDITAEVAGSEAGLEIKRFQAKAGSGNVTVTGTFGVLQHGMPINLDLVAKNAQPVSSNIITANVNADLRVAGTVLERIDVTGRIDVNRATIGIPDSLPPDVAVLDVRRRGLKVAQSTAKSLVIGIDLTIDAPQDILVQGRGLDAELGGEIKLGGTSDDLQVSGGFNLQRGTFTIAGNTLTLTTPGRVGFDGAGLRKKIDPTLDFTATTTVTDSNVTLRITGFADSPRFEFTSNPTLPQDEIMARLLFGESAAQLSALQVAQIGAALATLSGVGGSGSNPLVKLQKTLGLDRLTVGSNTTTTATGATENSGAAIAAGRYVSKRVYIEGKQSTAGTSQVQVDVDLTKHLKLQTRLGNGTATTQGTTPENDPGSSVGISYQFEY